MEVKELEINEDELNFLYGMAFWIHTYFDGLEVLIVEWKVATLNFESPHLRVSLTPLVTIATPYSNS